MAVFNTVSQLTNFFDLKIRFFLYKSTKTFKTDLDRFSSIVKAFLDQSHEHPSFFN